MIGIRRDTDFNTAPLSWSQKDGRRALGVLVQEIVTVCICDALLDLFWVGLFGPIRCDKDTDILGKGPRSPLVAMNGKRTYMRSAFDIGLQCRSCVTKEASFFAPIRKWFSIISKLTVRRTISSASHI